MLDDVIRSYTALNEQSPSTAFASAAADAESLLEFVEDTRATIGQLLADYDTDADAAAALDTMDGIAFQQLGVYAPEYTGSYDFTQFEAISIAPGSPGESYSAELVFAEDAPAMAVVKAVHQTRNLALLSNRAQQRSLRLPYKPTSKERMTKSSRTRETQSKTLRAVSVQQL
jgi:hypothetical protein